MKGRQTGGPAEIDSAAVRAAVRQLREGLRQTQQQFADRLGVGIATVVRFELSLAPHGRTLAKLFQMARLERFTKQAEIFRTALIQELGLATPDIEDSLFAPARQAKMNPWKLYPPEELQDCYDKHVASILRTEGRSIGAVRLEFDASDGMTYVADIAPPKGPPPGLKTIKMGPPIRGGRRK